VVAVVVEDITKEVAIGGESSRVGVWVEVEIISVVVAVVG
jgi:hypothetical protein